MAPSTHSTPFARPREMCRHHTRNAPPDRPGLRHVHDPGAGMPRANHAAGPVRSPPIALVATFRLGLYEGSEHFGCDGTMHLNLILESVRLEFIVQG